MHQANPGEFILLQQIRVSRASAQPTQIILDNVIDGIITELIV